MGLHNDQRPAALKSDIWQKKVILHYDVLYNQMLNGASLFFAIFLFLTALWFVSLAGRFGPGMSRVWIAF